METRASWGECGVVWFTRQARSVTTSSLAVLAAPRPCLFFSRYIAMLAVDSRFRKRGIGSALVKKSLHRMRELGCDEAMLETEVTNIKALRLYERLGFLRDERLLK